MTNQTFRKEFGNGITAQSLFDWHMRPGAFERLVAPWEDIRMQGPTRSLAQGQQISVTVPLGPARINWRSEIASIVPGESFQDVQLAGPFSHWEHTHCMQATANGCALEDRIDYRLPLGPLGQAVAGGQVKQRLQRLFTYRHRVTQMDLEMHQAYASRPPMDVLISGASGLVGTALGAMLTTGGHRVRRLVRRKPRGADEFRWDSLTGAIDPRAVEGTDAVIHLAGESIAAGRWNRARKARVLDSRVHGTRNVVDAIRRAQCKPRALLSASAVGIYGAQAPERRAEDSPLGDDYLATVCRRWEQEAQQLTGTRVVRMRFGVILSAAGGALGQMLLPFKMGLGGRLGNGQQWMSWISLDDAIRSIHHALMNDHCRGAVNIVAPQAVTNAEFTRTLGRVLRRPTVAHMPAAVVRGIFGEMGDALLLGGQHVEPRKLVDSGFSFHLPQLETALRHQLGR